MKKRLLLLAVVLVVVGLCGSAAFALDPMGPPTAGLKAGQFSAGIEYSYSEMDLKFNEGKENWQYFRLGVPVPGSSGSEKLKSITIKNFKMNKVYANLGYGITDNWEAFLRLGGANADFKTKGELFEEPFPPEGMDSDTDFAIGFGTKATFYEQDDLKLGGLFQISWAKSGQNLKGEYEEDFTWSSSVEVELIEIQIALGPTYKLMDGVLIYGGPFLHFIDGDLDGKLHQAWPDNGITDSYREKNSFDIDECSIFGGYIGTQIDIVENTLFNIEWQHTADADAIATNITWRF